MKELIKQLVTLIEPGRRSRWLVLVCLGVTVGIIEMIGALLIFTVLQAVTAPTSPVEIPIFGSLGTVLRGRDGQGSVVLLAILIAGFFLVRAGAFLFQRYVQNRVAQSAGTRLSVRLVRGYLSLPYAFHLRRNSAELIRNATQSVSEVVYSVFVPVVGLMSEILLVIGLVIALTLTSPGGVLTALGVLSPLILILLRLMQPRFAAMGAHAQSLGQTTLQALQESLQGLREIKLFAATPLFERRYSTARAELGRVMHLRMTMSELPRVVLETALMLLILVLLVLIVLNPTSDASPVAVLGLLAYAAFRILPSLNRIVANLNSLRYAGAALSDLVADLELFDRTQTAEDISVLPFSKGIELIDVSFNFDLPGPLILREVNISIRKGESIGIVGPTGAGKSTLVDIVMGLLHPTDGSVLVDGVSIHDRTASWQSKLGIVPQALFLLDASLRSNIAFGVEEDQINDAEVSSALEIAQLTEFVDQLEDGLDTVVGERGVRLSGGQRQRLAIARALYRQPEVIIFDEGTSALDNVTESGLIKAIQSLPTRTLIMVAHRLTTVVSCDRIFYMKQGRIAASGTYASLLEHSHEFRAMALGGDS